MTDDPHDTGVVAHVPEDERLERDEAPPGRTDIAGDEVDLTDVYADPGPVVEEVLA